VDPKPPPSPAPPPVAAEPATSGLAAVCPICGESRENDAQFCQACGHNFTGGADAAPTQSSGLRGPLLWLVVAFWAILAVAGLYWLYTSLYVL
jgi:apolipoprotein N-acyltransferase